MTEAAEPQDQARAGEAGGDEQLPKQFGKYTLLRKLATGGMAELFLALHRSVAGFEKLIVIKRILPSMTRDRGFIEMLLHEARIAATLSHPNIVQIFDVGQIDGTYFIAMEHIHGEDIRSIVRAMKSKNLTDFPLEHSVAIALGTCAGLAYAHEKRDLDGRLLDIVHRDISPQNIVVTFTGDVKVVDFGIAKSHRQTGEDTKSGELKGKVPYMSPEQAAGHEIDGRSDIFATGVLLFELTTGKRLFKGSSDYETLKLICEREYPLPSDVRPGYPKALERIVMKALAKEREQRYQSARQMQQDLETFVRDERVAVSQVGLTQWMHSLFVEKLAQQKEALQDIKQLVDGIATQLDDGGASIYEQSVSTATRSAPGAAASIPAPPRRSAGRLWAAGIAALVVAAGAALTLRELAADREAAEQQAAALAAQEAARAAEVAQPRGSLTLQSKPAGCAIWLNGDLRPETTPATLGNLPLGSRLEVKLTKEGLEAYRETVTLTDASPAKTVSAELKSGSVTVKLDVEPPATVFVDGKLWRGERTSVEGLSADDEHKIVLSANGYQAKTLTFTAKQGETKTFTEKLVKGEPGAPTDRPAGAEPDKPAAAGSAKVRVGAKGGFCNVTVNGASVGPTPVEAPVTPGMVRVSCKPPSGPSMSQVVRVGPGETGRVSFKLEP